LFAWYVLYTGGYAGFILMISDNTKNSRYSRFNTAGAAHFITFRCFRNRKFLNYDRTRRYLTCSLLCARSRYKIDIWAYVIMPEHVHILLYPLEENYSISGLLKSIKQPVARKAIGYLKAYQSGILKFMDTGLAKPRYRFWQDGGGYDILINDCKDVFSIIEYIHNNPVKRNLVENPADWFWSSASEWLDDKPGPVGIDKRTFPGF